MTLRVILIVCCLFSIQVSVSQTFKNKGAFIRFQDNTIISIGNGKFINQDSGKVTMMPGSIMKINQIEVTNQCERYSGTRLSFILPYVFSEMNFEEIYIPIQNKKPSYPHQIKIGVIKFQVQLENVAEEEMLDFKLYGKHRIDMSDEVSISDLSVRGGVNRFEMNVRNLPNGVYTLEIVSPNKDTFLKRFNITN